MQLTNFKKKDLPILDYYNKMKGLANTLAATSEPLKDSEVVSYILEGLGQEYDPLVVAPTKKNSNVSLPDLYAYLINFEARLDQHNSALQFNISANATSFAQANTAP